MSPLFLNYWLAGGALLGLSFAPRRPWVAAPALAVLAIVVGLARGFLIPADLLHLPAWTGLSRECAAVLAWALWSGAARLAPAPWLPGPPAVAAGLGGALFGRVSGAHLAASAASEPRAAFRLALAASGGALIGRVGDPVLLALGERVSALWFAPLGLLVVAMSALGGPLPRPEGGDRRVTAFGALVAVAAAVLPAYAWMIVAVGALVLGAWGLLGRGSEPRPSVAPLGRSLGVAVGSVALVLVATSSGLVDYAAEGLQIAEGVTGPTHPALLALAGALVGALIDGPAMALLLAAFIDSALDMPFLGFEVPLALGGAVAGLGAVRAVGRLRDGRARWLAVIAAALAWATVVGWFLPVD